MSRTGLPEQGEALRPVRVRTSADLAAGFRRLALLLPTSGDLMPHTIGQLVGNHARSVLGLASIIAARDTVQGSTAPALIGASSELRNHVAALLPIRSAARNLRGRRPDDAQALSQQQRELAHTLDPLARHAPRGVADPDVRSAHTALRPALTFAPTLTAIVQDHVERRVWLEPANPGVGWARVTPTSPPQILAAARAAEHTATMMVAWLPPVLVPSTRQSRSPRDVLDPQIKRREDQAELIRHEGPNHNPRHDTAA